MPSFHLEPDVVEPRSRKGIVRRHDQDLSLSVHLNEVVRVLGAKIRELVVAHRRSRERRREKSFVDYQRHIEMVAPVGAMPIYTRPSAVD